MADEISSGTGKGLLAFLEWAGRRGELKPERASALLTASRRMLEIDDEYLATRVADLDLVSLIERFVNLNRTSYSVGSLQTYESRLRRAIETYTAWLAKDPNWKTGRAPKAGKTPSGLSADSSGRTDRPAESHAVPVSNDPRPAVAMTSYELPLRATEQGAVVMARLQLPAVLTVDEAERVANFVRSVAFAQPIIAKSEA